jgi:hypothetical protein
MKIYICGKITGDRDYKKKFYEAEERLYELGYYPVNPAAFVPANTSWEEAMKLAIRAMLQCDGVSLLPDWKQSKGAKIEARLARELGMDVRPGRDWLL